MKIPVLELQKAMSVAVRFLDKKNVIPVTAKVKLDFESALLRVTTTNHDRSFVAEIPMECEEPYTVLIDGVRFHTFISQISDEYIDVSSSGDVFTVKRKGGKTQFVQSAESYPAIFSVPDIEPVIFSGDVLSEVISAALCGSDESEGMIEQWKSLIHINAESGKFRAITSDQKRFVLINGECDGDAQLQIPIGVASLLRPIVKNSDVRIYQTNNHIFVQTEYLFIFRRVVAEIHKDLEAFLARGDFKTGFTVEAEALSNKLGLVRSLIDVRLSTVKWELGEDVVFSSHSAEGSAEESLGIKPEIALIAGYNIDWLLSILRQLSGEITCEFWSYNGSETLQIRRNRLTETKFIVGSRRV